jgi:hypothetical protein
MASTSATLAKGYSGTLKRVTGGTCTCTNDVWAGGGGTCTCTTLGSINSYTINATTNAEAFNALGDYVEKAVPLMSSFELNVSGGFDYADVPQKAYWDNIVAVTAHASEKIRITDTKARHTMKGYITAASIGGTAQGLGTFSATFKLTLFPKTCTWV